MDQVEDTNALGEETLQIFPIGFEARPAAIEARPEPRADERLDLRAVVVLGNEGLVAGLELLGAKGVPEPVPGPPKEPTTRIR
jgi:hypothetical protein